MHGVVLPAFLDGDGQAAAGRDPAREDLGDGLASLLPRVPGHQDRRHFVVPFRHVDAAAAVHDEDHAVVERCGVSDQFVLTLGQRESAVGVLLLGLGLKPTQRTTASAVRSASSRASRTVNSYLKMDRGAACRVEILDHDGVGASGFEVQFGRPGGEPVVAPVPGHAFAADEDAVAVVAPDREAQRRVRRGFQYARPADREVVFGHPSAGLPLPQSYSTAVSVRSITGVPRNFRLGK